MIGLVLSTVLPGCTYKSRLESWGFEPDVQYGIEDPIYKIHASYLPMPSPYGPSEIIVYGKTSVATSRRLSRHPNGFTAEEWHRLEYRYFTFALAEIWDLNTRLTGTMCPAAGCETLPEVARVRAHLSTIWESCALRFGCEIPERIPIARSHYSGRAWRSLAHDKRIRIEGEPLPVHSPRDVLAYSTTGTGFYMRGRWCDDNFTVGMMLMPNGPASARTRRMARQMLNFEAAHEKGHIDIIRRTQREFGDICSEVMKKATLNRHEFYDPCSQFHAITWCMKHLPSVEPPFMYLNDPP